MKDNELTRRTAVGLAAGAAVSLAAGESWVFAAREGDVVKTPGDAAAWRPILFDEREAEGLARLVDALIPRTTTPGARDARVHEYIDLAVSLEPVEEKKAFVDGLRWLDRRSQKTHGADLATAEPADLVALLHSISDEHEDPSKALRPVRASSPSSSAAPSSATTPRSKDACRSSVCPTPSRCRPGAGARIQAGSTRPSAARPRYLPRGLPRCRFST